MPYQKKIPNPEIRVETNQYLVTLIKGQISH